MNFKQGQNFLALAILLLCLIAAPVGLWTKQQPGPPAEKSGKVSNEKGLSLLGAIDRIQVLKLSGMIMNDEDQTSLFPDMRSSANVRKQLLKAATNEHVKAVLLRINSPGGTVAMSQELNEAVRKVKESGKPIVVSMGDVTASGGYYIACAADKIFASPGTLTGSIGVIFHLLNLSEIEKKIGIAPMTVKSGQFKDMGTMDRAPTKEEQELLQALIMDSYDQFVTAVSEGRKMDREQVKKLADGRIYSGRQALKLKLVDALGGYDDALADLKKICFEKYHQNFIVDEGRSSMGVLSALLESKLQVPQVDVFKSLVPESMSPRFLHQPLYMME